MKNPISPALPSGESMLSSLFKQNEQEREPLIGRQLSRDYAATAAQEVRVTDEERGQVQPEEEDDPSKRQKQPKDWSHCVTQPIQYVPAVILGLLLNLLDAISYGMITFPLNNPIFAAFGPDGIAMFFVR